ncbi:hypothetical protein ACEPAG_4137 [Sanghuangporus baumii]
MLLGLPTESDLFDRNVGSCILRPEVTQGSYPVSGEYILSNVTDSQVSLCMQTSRFPTSRLASLSPDYTWTSSTVSSISQSQSSVLTDLPSHSTGVYSGVVTNRNGVGSDDPSNNNSTALRNIQQTFEDGFVQFISVFPGHYAQRISTS